MLTSSSKPILDQAPTMLSRKTFLLSLLTLGLSASAGAASKKGQDPDLAPGQMWSIKSDVPTTAKIIVGRIETLNGKVTIHVSVVDIPIPRGAPEGLRFVDHMPFEQSALVASLNQPLATGVPTAPNFEVGYAKWRSANGGIFTVSVSQAIKLMLDSAVRGRA